MPQSSLPPFYTHVQKNNQFTFTHQASGLTSDIGHFCVNFDTRGSSAVVDDEATCSDHFGIELSVSSRLYSVVIPNASGAKDKIEKS